VRAAPAPRSGFICSTLLAQAFALVGYRISGELPGDFETASGFDVVAADTYSCQPAWQGQAAA